MILTLQCAKKVASNQAYPEDLHLLSQAPTLTGRVRVGLFSQRRVQIVRMRSSMLKCRGRSCRPSGRCAWVSCFPRPAPPMDVAVDGDGHNDCKN